MIAPIVVIVGPTGSGKSALAMDIARRYNGEIICADSRTVYKYLDIGTAKPSMQDQQQVLHHLLDVVEPNQKFSAADFKQLAAKAITTIQARHKLPIMVGGSGLYINSIIFDYAFRPPVTEERRLFLEKFTTVELQALCKKDNIIMRSTNRRHLIRALETGQATVLQEQKLRPNTLLLGLAPGKEQLQHRIIKRTEAMFQQGVLKEAETVAARFGWENESMTGNIYDIARKVILKEIPLQLAIELAIKKDLQLAKRQMTWFRRDHFIEWGEPEALITKVAQFRKSYSKNNDIFL